MLKDLNIKAVYNSEEDNILNDFYIPALQNSTSYDRAVGYFDAKMLVSAASGLSAFVKNNGYMRLIVGATLNEEEYLAIEKGYSDRDILNKMENIFEDIIDSSKSDLFKYQLNTLAWLIQHNRLDVKIALRKHGIHHQKIGIFRDLSNDFLVFQGSANETKNALMPFNYETINVFKGWQHELKDHFEPHLQSFKNLWNNSSTNTLVLDFSDTTRRVLNKKNGEAFTPSIIDEIGLWQKHLDESIINTKVNYYPKIPDKLGGREFKLKKHQRVALEKWKANHYRGLFELATGAGKTITAIYALVKIYESRKKLFTVISVPYQSLADQWEVELGIFNIHPIVCYGGEANWSKVLEEKILDFKSGIIKFCTVVVVDATLSSSSKKFFDLITSLSSNLSDYFMFIGDECHHHGAISISNALPKNANLRIGLSATPDRGEEDIGNDRINDYYGDVIYSYTLKDALDDGVLTPYEYHLVPVHLNEEEADSYIDLSKRISKTFAMLKSSNTPSQHEDSLNILLNQRARIINGSLNKMKALNKILDEIPTPIKHSLFYCAEGMLDTNPSFEEEGVRRIQVVSKILHEYGWKTSQFTANENKKARKRILSDFKDGKVDSLVAMKCLDEGIDIPMCSTAFILSSSRQPRQFVQRRGRILRKSLGKEKAVIYDFFVTLPLDNNDDDNVKIGRKLMAAELRRINEFAHLALNRVDVYKDLESYLKKYDLHHYIV